MLFLFQRLKCHFLRCWSPFKALPANSVPIILIVFYLPLPNTLSCGFRIELVGILRNEELSFLYRYRLPHIELIRVIHLEDAAGQSSKLPRAALDRHIGSKPRHKVSPSETAGGFLTLMPKNGLMLVCQLPLHQRILLRITAVFTFCPKWETSILL